MTIIDKYPGAKPIQEQAGYCCYCLQPVRWNIADGIVHTATGQSRCELYATIKNEENQ